MDTAMTSARRAGEEAKGLVRIFANAYGAVLGVGSTSSDERQMLRIIAVAGAAVGALILGETWAGAAIGAVLGGLMFIFAIVNAMFVYVLVESRREHTALAGAAAVRMTLHNVRIESAEPRGLHTLLTVRWNGCDTQLLDLDAKPTGATATLPVPNPFLVPATLHAGDQLDALVVAESGEVGDLEVYGIFNEARSGLVVESITAKFPSWEAGL